MSILDRPHRRQLAELAAASKEVLNRLGPKSVTPEEEQAVARCWIALQKPAVAALEALDQTVIPFNEAEAQAARDADQGEPRHNGVPEIAPDAHLESAYEEACEPPAGYE